jgi:hypothetical protein
MEKRYMDRYEKLELDLIVFDSEDIIITSPDTEGGEQDA